MDKKSKMVGIAAVMAVIVSLLVVSVPAEGENSANLMLERDRPSKIIEKYGLQRTPPAPIDPKKLCKMPISLELIKSGLNKEEMKKFPKMPENRSVYKKSQEFKDRSLRRCHTDFGTIIKQSGTYVGSYAGQEVRDDVSLPYGDVLYAPTLFADKSALESTTFYWGKASGTKVYWGIYDHIDGGWEYLTEMNANFYDKYVRRYSEGDLYFTMVVRYGGNNNRVAIYNFKTHSWQNVAYRWGQSSHSDGWDIFEPHFDSGTCPSLPNIESTNLKTYIASSNKWVLVTPAYTERIDHLSCCTSYWTRYISNYYYWAVN
ncbi:MAG: hypothetical protein U9N35_01775 [Euryarchaeota archaeon]|nr:hypothetical protein [Euryarchaeota archaeon]